MALTISELNAVSQEFFDKTLEQQVYEDSPVFSKMKADKQIITDGGESIQWPARVAKLQRAKRTGPRTKVEFGSKETRTGATLEWCYYDADTMIHWDERNKNTGKGKIIDLAKDRNDELLQDIKDVLYAALFATTATEGTDLTPLGTIIDSATSYAGIAVADASIWASTEDSATTTMKLFGSGSLAEARNDATFGTKMPTIHVTTRDLFNKFESLLEPQVRYEDKKMANLGFSSLSYYGVPVVSDVFCPAASWFGIDLSAFELRVHKDDNMKATDWMDMAMAGYPRAVGKYVSWVGNLLARRRRTSFKFTALDYTL